MVERDMVIIPAGSVSLASFSAEEVKRRNEPEANMTVGVDALYLDRFAVTNGDFATFVDDGGYEKFELWPESILSLVLNFVDSTGCPGPAYWQNGRPPLDRIDHPVVGVSWYEAFAFAKWCGKRLPNCAEWQQAVSWADGGTGRSRYPWGDAFNADMTNTWEARVHDTVPVSEFAKGATPNGIYQMVGNVWEWTDTLFECECEDGSRIVTERPMAEIRGGAFDTYVPSQATGRFRSAQDVFARNHNLGFRLCLTANQLCMPTDSYAFCDQGEIE